MKKWWLNFHSKHITTPKLVFIRWFHKRFPGKYCWADCVAWSYDPCRFNPFNVASAKACQTESNLHETNMCYCGSWYNGKCWDVLDDYERDAIKKDVDYGRQLIDDLPF